MIDSDQDYLTEYRLFFDDFYKSVELNNPLPVHIGKYNISEFEITGEIISWCLEYLNSRKCPSSLIAPLCRSVQLEMDDIIRRDPESCGYRAEEDDYQTLKLMQATINKLVEVCMRYCDNSKLCRLPPPPPVTPSVSASAAKNIRRSMEDRHIVINDLHALFGIEGYGVASYYAVFDGHNGSDAAIYACSHIYQYLVESKYYPDDPESAFKEAFIRADDRFIDKSNKENLKSGTTAVCVLIRHDRGKVYVAWLGDSQAILVNGRDYIQLVNPHRPDHSEERDRIESMGGTVVFWGTWRVNGQLAVSRSIGDVDYKPYVTGEPDVSSYDLTGDEDFLLLACDGLWDVVSEQQAVEKVYDYLKEFKGDRSGVSKSLVTAAKSLGSKDNISVVVAWLDMSTLENGHFGQEPEVDVTDDLLPPVLRNLKPSPQITSAPQKLDESAEQWLKTLPWSYADVLRKPAPRKDEPAVMGPARAEPPAEPAEPEVEPATQGPPHSKGEDLGDVAGEADSGEDSDEEWNYISGKENREPNQQNKEELSREDMESQLNPNAAEFVPVVYAAGTAEADIASSPCKGSERSLEDITMPNPNEFFKEICKRPSDIGENDTSINGDTMSNISTKAVFGDDSVCLNSTVDSMTAEPLKDTNPFAFSQVPSFVQDHFSIEENSGKDPFSLSDIEFKPFAHEQLGINFMNESAKTDLMSPSSPSNVTKLQDDEINVNDVSNITFGDGIEDIIRSKQDSPLLKESPEPGLGQINDNEIDATPEEQTNDKLSEFSSVKGVTYESDNIHIRTNNDEVSFLQCPETSIDSDPEQDDILVCPMKKNQNGIEQVHTVEENNSHEGSNDHTGPIVKDRHEETVDEDENDLCSLRHTTKETFQVSESDGNVDKELEAAEPEDVGIVEDSGSLPVDEEEKHIIGFEDNKKLDTEGHFYPEFSESNVEPIEEQHHGISSHVLSSETWEDDYYNRVMKSKDGVLPENKVELSHNEGLNDNKEIIDESVTNEEGKDILSDEKEIQMPIEDIISNENLISQNEVSESLELGKASLETEKTVEDEICVKKEVHEELICPMKLTPLTKEMEERETFSLENDIASEQDEIKLNSIESDHSTDNVLDHAEEHKNVINKEETPASHELLECSIEKGNDSVRPEDVHDNIEHGVNSVHSETEVCSMKKEIDSGSFEKIQEIIDSETDLVCSLKKNIELVHADNEDFKYSKEQEIDLVCSLKSTDGIVQAEKEESMCSLKQDYDLVCPVKPKETAIEKEDDKKREDDLVCSFQPKYDTISPEEVDLVCNINKGLDSFKHEKESIVMEKEPPMKFSSEYKPKFVFGPNEIDQNPEEQYILHEVPDKNKIDDSVLSNSNHEKDHLESESPDRRTSEEEEIIQQESEDALLNSSHDEPLTDEMSSSMIDHGEEKALPEAQSNQLNLVQELQFEVQEKQAEADTESDSGFEIINASEASTIEMEMRCQSEKEAGAVNEKLLMDRNEAETLEKAEELISNEIPSNTILDESSAVEAKGAEVTMTSQEPETASLPKDIPQPVEAEPLTRTIELEPLERTEMVNGTVTPPATPPATPAPGLKEETKEGLIAAAVAAAGVATAVAASSAAVAVSESKVEEKKSPVKKTEAPTTKAGVALKSSSKVAPSKPSPTKAPASKPSTPISKSSTPIGKSPAKPTSPTAKAATAAKTGATASKPGTPTSKVGLKPAAKPAAPIGAKPAPTAASAATKPKPPATSTAKPPVSKTAPSVPPPIKKPTATTATAAKTSASSTTRTAAPKPAVPKPPAPKPAAAKPGSAGTGKPPVTKQSAVKPAPATKAAENKPTALKSAPSPVSKAPSPRPPSAKGTSTTAAPAKSPATAAAKPPGKLAPTKSTSTTKAPTTTSVSKPSVPNKTAPAKSAPAAPLNKKPAAPTAIKKPTAPTDKSTKEASNKLTAKTALTKKIEEKKEISKKEIIGENEEQPAQVAIVTTTNGHISLIENGIPSTEIVADAN